MELFSSGARIAPREPKRRRQVRHDIDVGTVPRGEPRGGWTASRCSCGWWNDAENERAARSARAGHLATGN